MIRLNKLTDYGVVVLALMARQHAVATAPQLAQQSGVPLPTVAKILTHLARDGIVTSQRGVAGGYHLARAADQISMAEIVAALEGPIALTSCVDGTVGGCEVEQLCPMRGNWDRVNQAVRSALEQVTLADMSVNDIPGGSPRANTQQSAPA